MTLNRGMLSVGLEFEEHQFQRWVNERCLTRLGAKGAPAVDRVIKNANLRGTTRSK